MRLRNALIAGSVALGGAVALPATTATASVPAATVGPGGAVPFAYTGKITKIVVKKNQVTILVDKTHYVLITNTTTAITVKKKHSTVKKLTVGERIHVTGEELGPLLIALMIAG